MCNLINGIYSLLTQQDNLKNFTYNSVPWDVSCERALLIKDDKCCLIWPPRKQLEQYLVEDKNLPIKNYLANR